MARRRFVLKKTVTVFRGRILDVKKEVFLDSHIVQGFKNGKSPEYQPPGTQGGLGTFRIGFPESETHLFLHATILGYGRQRIEIREAVLRVNGRERLSEKLLEALRAKLKGQVVEFRKGDNGFALDDESLLNTETDRSTP